jgi:DNA-binding HxlR family transcriptional regulator
MGDWWTPLILRDLHLGIDRFDDLVTDLGISRNLLTTRLAGLVEHGLVSRVRYEDHPPRHRYVLEQAGLELVPILAALTAWGDRWRVPEGGPPVLFGHEEHACVPEVACSTCGAPLTSANLEIRPGPGGRKAPGTLVAAERVAGRVGAEIPGRARSEG